MITTKPFAVNLWCSHPDECNDDCQSGAEFDTLEEAEKAYAAPVTDPHAAFVELMGPDSLRRVRRNPSYDAASAARKRASIDAEWRREQAMQAGMGLGVQAYNEEMGYD